MLRAVRWSRAVPLGAASRWGIIGMRSPPSTGHLENPPPSRVRSCKPLQGKTLRRWGLLDVAGYWSHSPASWVHLPALMGA